MAIGVAGFREGTNGRGGRGNGRRSGNIGEFGSMRRKHSSTGNGQGQGLRYGRGDHVGPRTYVEEGGSGQHRAGLQDGGGRRENRRGSHVYRRMQIWYGRAFMPSYY